MVPMVRKLCAQLANQYPTDCPLEGESNYAALFHDRSERKYARVFTPYQAQIQILTPLHIGDKLVV